MTEVPTSTTIDVEVRYAETDQMGVVHHSRYLVWFELARTQLCREAGHPYDEIEKKGLWLMVSGAHLSYRDGARYGDTVQVGERTLWIETGRDAIIAGLVRGSAPLELRERCAVPAET